MTSRPIVRRSFLLSLFLFLFLSLLFVLIPLSFILITCIRIYNFVLVHLINELKRLLVHTPPSLTHYLPTGTHLAEFYAFCEFIVYEKDDEVILRGETEDFMIFLLQGGVNVHISSKKKLLISSPDFVGENGMFSPGSVRNADCIAACRWVSVLVSHLSSIIYHLSSIVLPPSLSRSFLSPSHRLFLSLSHSLSSRARSLCLPTPFFTTLR